MLEAARQERRGKVWKLLGDNPRPKGLPPRRTLIALVVVVVALILVALLQRPRPTSPDLVRSCTTPAIALSPSSPGDPVRYALTGPAEGTYVVAVDAASAKVTGKQVETTPAGSRAVSVRLGLPDCGSSGTLPALSPGRHTVVLFRDGTQVARAALPG